MPPKIYIDGQAGTTALRIRKWLAGRYDRKAVLPDELTKDSAASSKATHHPSQFGLHPLLYAVARTDLLRDGHQHDQQREHNNAESAQLLKRTVRPEVEDDDGCGAIVRTRQSCTSGKAGGLNCEPLKAVWPVTPARFLFERLQLLEHTIFFLLLSDALAYLRFICPYITLCRYIGINTT